MTLSDACDALFHTVNQRHKRHQRHRKAYMKYVKIPEALFYELVVYHVVGMPEPEERIKKGLVDKMDAILRHGYYSQYKTDLDAAAREEARRKYLDSAGISQDFRW